ncbi:uncharacterized protein LOC125683724 isoform X2 [Ostrea edulis]|uniref:uncharacterized protein LOC125683724 isoform X2 n=1 Tax=Ostrea edulis TaxID=37623 RepID=UPI0024AF9B61|nr:uncharacterized protein LOC125683724 isoform X2 [Ostrea edulis]
MVGTWVGPGTCRNGSDCYFRHADPECPRKVIQTVGVSEVDGDIASALQTLSVKFDDTKSPDKTAGTDVEQNPSPVGDTRKVICKEKYLSVKIDVSGQKNYKNADCSDETSASFSKDPSELKPVADQEDEKPVTDKEGESNKTDRSGLVKCGECGKLIHMKVLPVIPKDIKDGITDDDHFTDSDEVDDKASDVSSGSTYEYDELEQHYKDMLLSMNKEHLNFLQHDPRFHQDTFCSVCGRVFGKTRHLLQHVTDKVKSEDDEEDHKELLHELVMAFTTRDMGLDDNKECMETLLLHLVASYTGDSDSSSNNSNQGLSNFLRMLTLKKHLCDSDDLDYMCNPWGYDEDDMFELACQGIKPWDPEAGMALAYLNGEIDF